jgi:hypothetical protein
MPILIVTYKRKPPYWTMEQNEYFRCLDAKEAAELFEIYDYYRRKNINFVKAVKII